MADATAELAGTCTGPGPCDAHPLGHGDNWVNKAGGLPKYIRAIAHALQRQGKSESNAVQIAIGTVKNWASGQKNVSEATRARAAKAVAEWEALKAKAHASSLGDTVVAGGSLVFADRWMGTFANMGTEDGPTVAGVVLKAADTGRVLMLQRALDDESDPAAGTWEFPGGHHEPGDLTSLHTGIREWQEEVGQPFPEGGLVANTWKSNNGIYQGHIVVVPNESSVTMQDGRVVPNPDDPDGDNSESAAWWAIDDAKKNPALREECKATPWSDIKAATVQSVTASASHLLSAEVPEHSYSSMEFVTLAEEQFVKGKVYHFKHGWIPLDHPGAPAAIAAEEKRKALRRERTAKQPKPEAVPSMPNILDDMLKRLKPRVAGGRIFDQVTVTPWTERALVASNRPGSKPDDLRALIAAALTEVPKIPTEQIPKGDGQQFRIPLLLPTGVESGDRREFKTDSIEHRDLPVPLFWQKMTDDGHKASVIVGRIDKVDKGKHGLENAVGVFNKTPEAQQALELVRGMFLRGVSADVDKIDAEMSQADDGKPKVTFSAGRLTAATLVGKPAFAECMIELPGDNEWEGNMSRLKADADGGVPEPLVAAGGPMFPPSEWFDNPQLSEPTHLTVTDDGRVFGHIASWDTDHIGMPFQRAPRSRSDYRYFTTGQLKTQEGQFINVGQLTLVGGHADLSLDAQMAVQHYDDTKSAVADVTIGEDEFGIWVAGAARPELSDMQLRQFRASDSSGDWRPIGNNLELVAVCQVNCAGFPVTRARVASGGKVTALVAAGAPALLERTRPEKSPGNLLDRVERLEAAQRAEVAMELRATVAAGRKMVVDELRATVASLRPQAGEVAVTAAGPLDNLGGKKAKPFGKKDEADKDPDGDGDDDTAVEGDTDADKKKSKKPWEQFASESFASSDEHVQAGDEFSSDNKWIRKRGNKHVIIQKGTGKVISSHDTKEKAEAAFRGMMKSKTGS